MDKSGTMKKTHKIAVTKGKGKKFIIKGNILSLAFGIILGTVLTALVNAMVTDILGFALALVSGVSFNNLFVVLHYGNHEDFANGIVYTTVEQANAANAITLNYGRILQSIIQFFMGVLLCSFIIVMCSMPKKEEINRVRFARKPSMTEPQNVRALPV